MPTSNAATVLLRDVCERLAIGRPWPAVGTTTALGSTTTLADATNLAYADADTDALANPWIRIDELVTNGPASGTVMKVRDAGLTVATGVVTFSPATLAVQTGTDYSLWWEIHPLLAWRIVNRVMRLVPRQMFVPVSVFADAEMESSATTDYTSIATATLSKVTTAVNVRHGIRSLRIEGNGAAPTVENTAYFRVRPGAVWLASCAIQADVGTATFLAYDKTNSAAIANATGNHRLQAFSEIEIPTFTIPDTCERLTLRITGTADADDFYLDNMVAWPVNRNRFDLPSYVEDPSAVIELGYWKRGTGISSADGTNAYALDEGEWVQWPYEIKEHEQGATTAVANPFWIEFPVPITRPLFLKVNRPFGEFSADTDTSTADRETIVQLTLYHIYRHLFAAYKATHPETASTENPWYEQMLTASRQGRVRRFYLRHGQPHFEIVAPRRT